MQQVLANIDFQHRLYIKWCYCHECYSHEQEQILVPPSLPDQWLLYVGLDAMFWNLYTLIMTFIFELKAISMDVLNWLRKIFFFSCLIKIRFCFSTSKGMKIIVTKELLPLSVLILLSLRCLVYFLTYSCAAYIYIHWQVWT